MRLYGEARGLSERMLVEEGQKEKCKVVICSEGRGRLHGGIVGP